MHTWTDPRSLLGHAALYKRFQTLIGGRRARRRFIEHIVRPRPGQRVLDIGCGPGDILDFLPDVDYYGVDIDPLYIAAAARRYGHRGTFICSGVDSLTLPALGAFDLVLAVGLVHHLDDAQARRLFRLSAQALNPAGRLVTMDGCFVPGQQALARLLLKADRGGYVRAQAAYEALAGEVFTAVKSTIAERFFHVPYTLLMMECRNASG
jgi:SAM-dependent methyltransferase